MEIYKITNTFNNKCYIGKTYSNFRYRYGKVWHTSSSLSKYLKHSINYHGASVFTTEILHKLDNENTELLSLLECHYIELYKSNNSDKGYNLTTGGDGGMKHTEISRSRLSLTKKGKKPEHLHTPEMYEYRIKRVKEACCGVKISASAKKKMSESKKKVFIFEVNGKINKFKGLKASAEFYKVSVRTITRATSNNKEIRTKVKWLKCLNRKFLENEGNN